MTKNEKGACPICGHTKFQAGKVRSHGISFMPDDTRWLKKQFSIGYSLKARRCLSCGNVQMFTKEK